MRPLCRTLNSFVKLAANRAPRAVKAGAGSSLGPCDARYLRENGAAKDWLVRFMQARGGAAAGAATRAWASHGCRLPCPPHPGGGSAGRAFLCRTYPRGAQGSGSLIACSRHVPRHLAAAPASSPAPVGLPCLCSVHTSRACAACWATTECLAATGGWTCGRSAAALRSGMAPATRCVLGWACPIAWVVSQPGSCPGLWVSARLPLPASQRLSAQRHPALLTASLVPGPCHLPPQIVPPSHSDWYRDIVSDSTQTVMEGQGHISLVGRHAGAILQDALAAAGLGHAASAAGAAAPAAAAASAAGLTSMGSSMLSKESGQTGKEASEMDVSDVEVVGQG